MEIPIELRPMYPWGKLGVGDHFVPPDFISKHTLVKRTSQANYKYRPKRFAAKTTKGRWEIRRVA